MSDTVMYIVGGFLAVTMGILSIGHYIWMKNKYTSISLENLEKAKKTKEAQELEDESKVA